MEIDEYQPGVYMAGDRVPVSSSLYRMVHDPPREGERLLRFYADDHFPPCPDCGMKVRYVLASRLVIREDPVLGCRQEPAETHGFQA
jgi:hypothetical protein